MFRQTRSPLTKPVLGMVSKPAATGWIDIMVRTLRLVSGLVLFGFVTCHLVNMALGLHSIELADRARPYLTEPWTRTLPAVVLIILLLVHAVLGLRSFYLRNTLKMSGYDRVQLIAGLLVIPLLASHVIGIAGTKSFYNYNPTYWDLSHFFWIEKPLEGLRQVLIVVVAWIHGAIGMFSWLRLRPWWQRISWFVYPVVVAVPVLALLGFVQAGNEVISDSKAAIETVATDPATAEIPAVEETVADDTSTEAALASLRRIWWTVIEVYLLALAITFAARSWRLRSGNRNALQITYLNGPTIKANAGPTLLELARLEDLPHANLCRGRGRCGTCRVRILESSEMLPPPGPIERQTLDRFHAPEDVRLACQLAPARGYIKIERLVSPIAASKAIMDEPATDFAAEPMAGS
jgi:adenylate cyclase